MMTLRLENVDFSPDGIFGVLEDPQTAFALDTLQHSYEGPGGYVPKLSPGIYTCTKGIHKLKNMIDEFITFQVENVPGHTGILFHCGNFNSDSDGCILVGFRKEGEAILESQLAFQHFMDYTKDVDSFTLEVV